MAVQVRLVPTNALPPQPPGQTLGWAGLDDIIVDVVRVISGNGGLLPFLPHTFNSSYSFELDSSFVRPLPATQQQWTGLPAQPLGQPLGFTSELGPLPQVHTPANPPPLHPKEHPWDSFAPAGSLLLTPLGPRIFEDTPKIVLPLSAAQQQWTGVVPPPTQSGAIPQSDGGLVFADQVAIGQFSTVPQSALVTLVVVEGWRAAFDPKFVPIGPLNTQRWDSFEPLGGINSLIAGYTGFDDVIVDVSLVISGNNALPFPAPAAFNNFYSFELDTAFVPPTSAARQRSEFWSPEQTIFQSFVDGWRAQLDTRFRPSVAPAQQQWTGPVLFPGFVGAIPNSTEGIVLVDQPVIYQTVTAFSPAPSLKVDGWRAAFDPKFVAPIPAAGQRWDAYEPRGAIALSTFANGWLRDLDTRSVSPFGTGQQQWASYITFPTPIFVEGWRGYEVDAFVKPFNAGEQQWAPWEPQYGVFLDGWSGLRLETQFVPPFKAAQQRWEAFEPQGVIGIPSNTTPSGWGGTDDIVVHDVCVISESTSPPAYSPLVYSNAYQLELDYRFATPFAPARQQWAPWMPEKIVNTVVSFADGWRGYELDAFKPRFNASQQRWESFEPRGVISSGIFPNGFKVEDTPRIVNPLSAAQQQWTALTLFPTFGFAVPESEGGGVILVDQPAIYQTTALGLPPPASALRDGWRAAFDAKFRSGFAAAEQQWAAWTSQTVAPTIPLLSNGLGLDQSFIPQPRLFSSAQQQWTGLPNLAPFALQIPRVDDGLFIVNRPTLPQDQTVGLLLISPTANTTTAGWYGSAEPAFHRPFTYQDYTLVVPAVQAYPNGWWGFETDAFGKPFPASDAQWDAFVPLGTVVPGLVPLPWTGFDDIIADVVPIISQNTLVSFRPAPTPNSAYSFELDVAFVRPIPVTQPQWSGWAPKAFANIYNTRSEEYGFTRPFPIGAQLIEPTFQPAGVIVTILPDGWRGLDDLTVSVCWVIADGTELIPPPPQLTNFRSWFGSMPLDVRFELPFPTFPIQLQRWDSGTFFAPPMGPVLGGGGKRLLQLQFPQPAGLGVPAQPHKPVQPIWDRQPDPEPAPKPEPKVAKLPPLTIFGGSAQQTPIDTKSLPTFGQYTIPRVLSLAERLKQAKIQFMQDDDAEALKLLLEDDGEDQ